MFKVMLMVWLASCGFEVHVEPYKFTNKAACTQMAPYIAQKASKELPPMRKGKARCVKVGQAA